MPSFFNKTWECVADQWKYRYNKYKIGKVHYTRHNVVESARASIFLPFLC